MSQQNNNNASDASNDIPDHQDFVRNYDSRQYSLDDLALADSDIYDVDSNNVDPANISYHRRNALNAFADDPVWYQSNEHMPTDATSNFEQAAPQPHANEPRWYPFNENVPAYPELGSHEESPGPIVPTGADVQANGEDTDEEESIAEYDIFNSKFPSIGLFYQSLVQNGTLDEHLPQLRFAPAANHTEATPTAEAPQGLPAAEDAPVEEFQIDLHSYYAPWPVQYDNDQDSTPSPPQISLQPLSGLPILRPAPTVPVLPDLRHAPAVPVLPPTGGQLQFANYAQAQTGAATRQLPHDWQAPQNDITIPQNDAQRSVYVKQLVTAFKDITQCIDSAEIDGFKERWETLATGESVYTDDQIETVCWKLVTIAEDLHTQGPRSLGVLDKDKLANAMKSRKQVFSVRIQHMCTLLRLSKARCETLLKFDNLPMFVSTTLQLISQDKMNKKQNAIRQADLVEGRYRTRNEQLTVQRGPGAEEDGEEGLNEEQNNLSTFFQGSGRAYPAHDPSAVAYPLGLGHFPGQIAAGPPVAPPMRPPFAHDPSAVAYPMGLGHFPGQNAAGPPAAPPMRPLFPPVPGRPIPLTNNVGATNQRVQPNSLGYLLTRKRPTSDGEDTLCPARPPTKRHM